jgi:ABC-type sugar transport system permease subunit
VATTSVSVDQQRAADRRSMRREMKRNIWAYVFISPFYILYAVFGMFPLLYGVWLSFFK